MTTGAPLASSSVPMLESDPWVTQGPRDGEVHITADDFMHLSRGALALADGLIDADYSFKRLKIAAPIFQVRNRGLYIGIRLVQIAMALADVGAWLIQIAPTPFFKKGGIDLLSPALKLKRLFVICSRSVLAVIEALCG